MKFRRLFAIGVIALAAVALVPVHVAGAQAPDPTDSGDDAPPTGIEPIVDGSSEVVHSWALTPGGSPEDGVQGNRPDLTYVVDPGSTLEDSVTLYNMSNVPLSFRVYATDATNNDEGAFDLLPGSQTPTDVGAWVTLPVENVTVPPGQQVTIPISISVPDGAAPGDHVGAILASSAAVSAGPDDKSVTLDRRTGTRLYLRVNGPIVPELVVADVEMSYSPALSPLGGSAEVTYRVENRGNVRLSGATTVSASGPFGLGEKHGEGAEIPELLPGEDVTLTTTIDNVPAMFLDTATVDLTTVQDGEAAGQSSSLSGSTFAPPIAVLMFLLVVLFGLLALRAIRRHRDRDGSSPDVEVVEVVDVVEREPQPL